MHSDVELVPIFPLVLLTRVRPSMEMIDVPVSPLPPRFQPTVGLVPTSLAFQGIGPFSRKQHITGEQLPLIMSKTGNPESLPGVCAVLIIHSSLCSRFRRQIQSISHHILMIRPEQINAPVHVYHIWSKTFCSLIM